MTEPQLNFVQCISPTGLHRMAYWEWAGPTPEAPVLLCVHGLARQGRDFDSLARALQDRYRVVCPDVVGRGRSDWLPSPQGYTPPAYVPDMVALIARLGVEQVDWLGTSMGGLIGLGLAAQPVVGGRLHPIRRLILNDVGPSVKLEWVQRIQAYLGKAPSFDSFDQGVAYLSAISAGFGPHTPAQWAALSKPMLLERDGRWHLHYDPAIAVAVAATTAEVAAGSEALLWHIWDSLRCPALVLRGSESDVLPADVATAMSQRGPRARVVEFAGVGHAPTLVQPEQIAAVRAFLDGA
jgi:pimeloyl-ACP methyl ester carboxylesterase